MYTYTHRYTHMCIHTCGQPLRKLQSCVLCHPLRTCTNAVVLPKLLAGALDCSMMRALQKEKRQHLRFPFSLVRVRANVACVDPNWSLKVSKMLFNAFCSPKGGSPVTLAPESSVPRVTGDPPLFQCFLFPGGRITSDPWH